MSSVASTFWDGPVARAMVQVLSYRLPARSGATAYAPRRTEVLVCESVLSAFDALQKPLRDSLPALPAIVRNLEKRLLGLRARLEELDVMLADLSGGEALATQLSTEALPKRSTDGVQRLTALRLECECQLVRAIGALEQLRIGLMLLRVGSGDAEGLEEDLKRAEELSLQLERLLSGQREVTELLARDVGE